jgi:hypothetical protein
LVWSGDAINKFHAPPWGYAVGTLKICHCCRLRLLDWTFLLVAAFSMLPEANLLGRVEIVSTGCIQALLYETE